MAFDLAISACPWHFSDWHPQTYLIIFDHTLKKLNYLQLLRSSTRTAIYDPRLQLQLVPNILLVPLDGLKFNHTGSVLFDSVFQDIMVYFGHHFNFSINFGLIAASRLVCSWIGLLRTLQHSPIQHSMSPPQLQSVGLSQILHLMCKFSVKNIIVVSTRTVFVILF